MDTTELFQRFGIALAIGLLIGLERGWRTREDAEGSRVAGVRTYALMSFLGALWSALTPAVGPWPLALAGLALAGALTVFSWRGVVAHQEFSVTGVIVGLVTFALGAFAILGDKTTAGAAGIAVVLLLTAREYLHNFLRSVSWPELRSAATLLAMSFLALPILPNRTIDPWQAINPHNIWLMTVLVAAVSFIGYIAARFGRGRAAFVTAAAAGALISSTLLTLVNSRLAARSGIHKDRASTAICVGWIVSLLRLTALAGITNATLLPTLAIPITAAVVALVLAGLYFNFRTADERAAKLEFGNPFDLLPVLGLGALLAVIMVVTKLVNDHFGQAGILPLAAFSGLADVDPITLSLARIAGTALTSTDAAIAILAAATANMVTKIAIPLVFGGWRFGAPLAVTGVVAIIAGGVALALSQGFV